ncbi:hypothetical protein HYC85_006875 [Camellia sinensis]|uniref:Uncharacterized protein n=1 Tax=Camellia sinensis TaxID=4442 RepID=A0A7J7HMQ2_CAMSI|nr:hypothetical protein HYC85_006875 [Camellia sinensis]
MAAGGAQTNSTTRSNPAGDARLPAVGGLGGLGLPEMFGSMQDTASLKTTVKQIEEAFEEFTTREDVVIVMISQYVANMIKFLVDSYNNPIPAILEIPSKDHPYDPTPQLNGSEEH